MSQTPTVATHRPVMAQLPADEEVVHERAPIPPPTLWRPGVKVTHKATQREGVVRVVDLYTLQFRLVGESRTTWQAMKDWDVLVEPTEEERERQSAGDQLREELSKLDAEQLALVEVLVDDPDPRRALAKLHAMRKMGVVDGPGDGQGGAKAKR